MESALGVHGSARVRRRGLGFLQEIDSPSVKPIQVDPIPNVLSDYPLTMTNPIQTIKDLTQSALSDINATAMQANLEKVRAA